ncbi:serine/threonine-protein kinase [Chamaesiphon sp. VAR_69_metabat_338]|uniref:serine/threonine-protein kinase n=1 Tax=Chamaesiphon sp. VAR_69_metabat_338 TaxID=2964704 RepID=UPI00286E7CB7|nr:serine/threonine-protein kinase [Chamaesiphon sp. VAR_69_metabat_338]
MSLCINPQCPQTENSDRMLFCQSCGSELLLAGKYRVAKLMSNKGGFGDTYEVTERGVPKVLKVLKSNNTKAIELFDREYRVLASLAGEGIAGIPLVEDFFLYSPNGSQTALHCLVMERIFGMDLEEYIKVMKRPIDQKTAIGWLLQLTQILQEIHTRGIFHRDIKPSNLILQPDGQVVAIDFGAVKQAAVATANGQRTRIYTPGYAAPEQEQGEASAQSDFFALGRTFVYLLTAKEPVDLHDSYRDLLLWRDKTTNVSADFLDLIDRLMQADPRQRPDTTTTIFREIAALSSTITRQHTGYQQLPASTTPTFKISQPKVVPTSAALSPPAPQQSFPFKKLLPALVVLTALLLLLPALAMYLFGNKQPSIPGITSNTTGESFTAIKDVPQGTFKFGGSTTWATTRQLQSSIDAAIRGVYPQFDIEYTDAKSPDFKSVKNGKCDSKPGSNAGICWLLEGDLDFAQSSIALEKSTYKNDDRIKTQQQLKQKAVAYDALSIVVNPKLNLTGLTIDQLRDIYTGSITNWRQVGGPNLPIVAFARPESTGGTVSSFYDLVLKKKDKQQFRDDKWQPQFVGSTTEGLQKVSRNLGGIYYGAAKEVIIDSCNTKPLAIGKAADNLVKPYRDPLQSPAACRSGQRNQLNTVAIKSQTYPLTRLIYVIIKTTNPGSKQAGEAYANLLKTQQGQQLLEKAGFVSISD